MPNHTQRPLSPHLGIWRWHVTMLSSILHRMSGVALYAAAAAVVGWLLALSAGPDSFACAQMWLLSPLGQLALVGVGAAVGYHMANGIRHLAWDMGYGFAPKVADLTAWISILAGAVAAAAVAWGIYA